MDNNISDKILVEIISMKEQMKNFPTKDDLRDAKSEILGEVDSFIKLHETLDLELTSLRHMYGRLEERVEKLERITH